MTMFKDRTDAGQRLAELLRDFKDTNTIILALPRGGVVVGNEIARVLGLPLDIVVTRKIGAPGNSEYAIGAIDMNGAGVWNDAEIAHVDQQWLNTEKEQEQREAERRWRTYRGERAPLDLNGKTVIIVDDGIATGMTMEAAIHYIKKLGATRVVVATPIAPPSAVERIKKEAEVRTLTTPSFFFAIGEYYEIFPQITDEEVIAILKKSAS